MKNTLSFLVSITLFFPFFAAQAEIHLDQIKLPPHFKISVFQGDVKGARSMAWGKKGTLFVGSREEGKVYAITPDHHVYTLASKLNYPNGVAFREGDLYVAEINRVLKFKKIEENLAKPLAPEVIKSDYPKDLHHGWKFIAFGPDQKLYIPVGANCNICEVKDPYAAITRLDANGKNFEVIERGIRNTVGFDWHPITHELWFTDNGRDMLGEDLPSDELNHATKIGMHFGFPYCHQGDTLDPEFGKGKKCADYTPPEQKLGAHVASLGMRFYTGKQFPSEYENQIFIAEHGSWNRTVPSGYRVVLARVSADHQHATSNEVFAEGWLHDGKAWGRPVDVIVASDGALLVSDDFADAIYRISYQK